METLAERTMAYGGIIDLSMNIYREKGEIMLSVCVRDANSLKPIKRQVYTIIDELETWDDVLDDTIGDAVILLERSQAEAEQNNNEETSNN